MIVNINSDIARTEVPSEFKEIENYFSNLNLTEIQYKYIASEKSSGCISSSSLEERVAKYCCFFGRESW